MEYVIDAKNKKLGRVASEVAVVLQGKDSASYEKNQAGETRVVIKNAAQIEVSGRKEGNKVYYRHTGYVGNLKTEHYEDVLRKNPAEVIRRAVFGMLPVNSLRDKRMKRLIIEK